MYIDSHAHLHTMKLKGCDLDSILDTWESSGGGWILDPGTDSGDLAERKACAIRPFILFAAGIWPGGEALVDQDTHMEILSRHASDPSVAAIGECGLDYFRNQGQEIVQEKLFASQIELANRLAKPLIVHTRNATQDTLRILIEKSETPGIIHCCPFSWEESKRIVEKGFFLSFAGNVTYKNSQSIRESAVNVPLDRILVETDSPYLSPEGSRGKVNTPLAIPTIVRYIADLRGIDPEILSGSIEDNFINLFHLHHKSTARRMP